MELTAADIKLIVSTLQESDFDEAEVVIGAVRIAVARGGAHLSAGTPTGVPAATPVPVAPAAVPVAPTPAAPVTPVPTPAAAGPEDLTVTAPSVGVFWRSPEPGAPPFVEVGARVEVGDTLGIVEVMKLMSIVVAEVAGVVSAVHVENAQGVEFGTPLISIRPGD